MKNINRLNKPAAFKTRITLYLSILFFYLNCSNQNPDQCRKSNNDRIPVIPMEWVEKDHILEGWDWSLPPSSKPHQYSGTTMPWTKDGRRYDLPRNEFKKVRAKWRELEPEDGKYNFELLRERIKANKLTLEQPAHSVKIIEFVKL